METFTPAHKRAVTRQIKQVRDFIDDLKNCQRKQGHKEFFTYLGQTYTSASIVKWSYYLDSLIKGRAKMDEKPEPEYTEKDRLVMEGGTRLEIAKAFLSNHEYLRFLHAVQCQCEGDEFDYFINKKASGVAAGANICTSFVWMLSKESHEYWHGIHRRVGSEVKSIIKKHA